MQSSEHREPDAWQVRAERIRHQMKDTALQRDAWRRRAIVAEAAVVELQLQLDALRKATNDVGSPG